MEVITAQLESLLWVFTPAGVVTALSIFALLASGLPGRLFPRLEVGGSYRRTARRGRTLETVARGERIIR